MRRILQLAVACVLATPAAARTLTDEQAWINVTALGSISGRLLYFAEVQPRFGAGSDHYQQWNLRPALGWQASPAVSLYGGYAYVHTDSRVQRATREHRGWQQLSWTLGPTAIGTLSSRTRLEQRWRNDGDDTGWRLRQMLRTAVPLAPGPHPVKALASVETFVALNGTDWGARAGFDQLRSFAGVELPLKGKSTIEAGYLNQIVNARHGVTRVNHVLSLALFVRH